MNISRKTKNKLHIKQWNIGIAKGNFSDFLKNEKPRLKYKWICPKKKTRLFADPFIFNDKEGHYKIIYEDMCLIEGYGKLSVTTIDENLNIISSKLVLNTGKHISYPKTLSIDNKLYIIPESSANNILFSYEYDFEKDKLINQTILIENIELLDSTILFHKNKYWLFGTHLGNNSNSELYIYYSQNLKGPYEEHHLNPVKKSLNGSRPAGNFIKFENSVYRPAQNNEEYYGKSITIFKINKLSETEFSEDAVIEIEPPIDSVYSNGIHTINFLDEIIVIDGLRIIFSPIDKIKIYLNKIKNNLFVRKQHE